MTPNLVRALLLARGRGPPAVNRVAAQAAPPPRVTLDYEMSHNGTVMVEVKETLEHDGKTYRIEARRGAARVSTRSPAAEGVALEPGRDRRRWPEGLGVPRSARQRPVGGEARLVGEDTDAGAGRQDRNPAAAAARLRPLEFPLELSFVAPPAKGRIVEAAVADGRGAPAQYRYAIAGRKC